MRRLLLHCALVLVAGCGDAWNDPYPASAAGTNTLYTAFSQRPKTLDPARSYVEDEAAITQLIYEPPLQYHYLKRPYELVPLAAVELPRVRLLDRAGRALPADAPADKVAFSEYEIKIKPGILYQPHPAFARDDKGKPLYLDLTEDEIRSKFRVTDFAHTGTRELVADDYVYQIKRLAHPQFVSPIFGHMSEYIVGLSELGATLRDEYGRLLNAHETQHGSTVKGQPWVDLRHFPLAGVEARDKHRYYIRIKGKYPQFVYWLAMPFFAPLPVEADRFYSQRGMNDGRNLTLDWFPVGTGPYMLTENNPNARMILERNPNFRGEAYPTAGEPGDAAAGLLADAGRTLPFIDRIVYSRERESIPYWNKFLQGYYDESLIASDNFDQAVRVDLEGESSLTPELASRGIRLSTSVATTTSYFAFNFLDPVVGGLSDRAKKLRQAISIAIDWEEYISIFRNGRAIAAMGPVPPGISGYREGRPGLNTVLYDWVDERPHRKPIEAAKKLLAAAGYPDGRDARTGAPLVLHYDAVTSGPADKPRLDWYRRQLAKLNIQLEVRATDFNRFQEKVRSGNAQLFFWGWNADYPDPENFMFLLYGPQSRAKFGGENTANYQNPEYDRLFEQMKNMVDGPERQAIIDRMMAIVRADAPLAWAYHAKDYELAHAWVVNAKANHMARNVMKYYRVDPALRDARRAEWNRPVLWPLGLGAMVLIASFIPAVRAYRRRERAAARAAG